MGEYENDEYVAVLCLYRGRTLSHKKRRKPAEQKIKGPPKRGLVDPFGSSVKIGTIQRRLAWPLRKDDMIDREVTHFFILFVFVFECGGEYFDYAVAPSLPGDAILLFSLVPN
jgi:hypothetical protein